MAEDKSLSDSDRARSVLQSAVNALTKIVDENGKQQAKDRKFLYQFYQFFIGQVPNGEITKIEPTKDSWCGLQIEWQKRQGRLMWGILSAYLALGVFDRHEAILKVIGEALKWAGK